MGKKGACSGKGLTGPATCLVKDSPGSSTSGPTGNDWLEDRRDDLDLTTAYPIEIGQEVPRAGAIPEHSGEVLQAIIGIFNDADVVDLQPFQDLPEHCCIEVTALQLLTQGGLKVLTQ